MGPEWTRRSRAHGISPLGTSAEAPGPPSSGSARQEHRAQVSGAIAAVKGAKGLPVPGAVAAAPGPATQALQVTGAVRRLPGHVGARNAVAPAKRNRRAKCPSRVPQRLHRRAATLRRACGGCGRGGHGDLAKHISVDQCTYAITYTCIQQRSPFGVAATSDLGVRAGSPWNSYVPLLLIFAHACACTSLHVSHETP